MFLLRVVFVYLPIAIVMLVLSASLDEFDDAKADPAQQSSRRQRR